MIIWRGWGILAFLFAVMFIGGSAALSGDDEHLSKILMPIGMVLTGVATWFTGVHLNQKRPARDGEAYLAQRQAEIQQAVESGTFAPGGIRPSSLDEARAQGQAMWEAERNELAGQRNAHTLFFVPMQYIGVLVGAAGVIFLVVNLVKG